MGWLASIGVLVGAVAVAACGDPENRPPEAASTCGPGFPQPCRVLPNGEATLDARGSTDPDGDLLSYRWYAVDSPTLCPSPFACPCGWTEEPFTGSIRDSGSPMTTFRAPSTAGSRLIFQVEVSDADSSDRACSVYSVEEF